MSPNDLVAVIAEAGKNGVTYLKTQELELHFAGHQQVDQEKINAVQNHPVPREGNEVDEDLVVTDPLAYEEQLAKERDQDEDGS